jgi:DNA-binding NarL/FixJ family response regulator
MKKHIITQKAIRIVIAISDPTLKADLKEKIELDHSFKVIGSARTGIESLLRCGELTPILVLMDFQMSECLTGCRMIKTGFPEIRVLIIGVKSEEELKRALQSGADGYLKRPVIAKELIDALKNVILGISVNNDYLYIP